MFMKFKNENLGFFCDIIEYAASAIDGCGHPILHTFDCLFQIISLLNYFSKE